MSYGFVVCPLILTYSRTYWISVGWMALGSFCLCFCLVKLYDWTKRDWLLLESLKDAQEKSTQGMQQNRITRKITKLAKRGKYILLVMIVSWDPTITVLYCRKGAYKYNGIPTKEVAALFILSCLLCDVVWAGALSLVFWMYHFFVTTFF